MQDAAAHYAALWLCRSHALTRPLHSLYAVLFQRLEILPPHVIAVYQFGPASLMQKDPCRLADSRQGSFLFGGTWGGGTGHRAEAPYLPLPRRRSSGKARRRRLALALPDALRCGYPARRRRNPAPQPREARTRAATRKAGKALTRGV